MAKKYDLDIDGYIGSWFSSKRYVKLLLQELGEKEITCRVNSLGGSLDDAIDIASQFEAQGKIVCDLYSLNASAATVLTLGAQKVRMHADAAYLIHKPLSWIETWGLMNEDDLEAAIERLKAEKDRAATLTLIMARMYAKKCKKPVQDVLRLMKAEKWLDAEQAKEWGLVDEIFQDASLLPTDIQSPEMLNLIAAAGLPAPLMRNVPQNVPQQQPQQKEEKEDARFLQTLLNELREIFIPSKNTPMNKTYASLNTLLNIEGIEFKNNKTEWTEDQVKILNQVLEQAEVGKKAATEKLSEKDVEIQALKDQIQALNQQAGDESNALAQETDHPTQKDKNTIDFASIKNLYHSLPD